MGYDLEKFSAGTMDKGISARSMDFQGELTLGIGVYNLSQGIQQGLGPRPGMASIPGQNDNEAISGSRLPGLRRAESDNSVGFKFRRKVLGVYALKIASPLDVTEKITVYAWLLTTVQTSIEYFDIQISSTNNGGISQHVSQIYAGLPTASVEFGGGAPGYFAEALVDTSEIIPGPSQLQTYLRYSGRNFTSSAVFSVTGANTPMQWFIGSCVGTGDVDTAPNVDLTVVAAMQPAGTTDIYCGIPTEYNLQNFNTNARNLKFFCLKTDGTLNMAYAVSMVRPSSTYLKQNIPGNLGVVSLDVSSLAAVKETAGTTYSDNKAVLVNDNSCITNSAYKAILAAARKAYCCIFQDAYTSPVGLFNQWFDLTQNSYEPRNWNTNYSEDAVNTNSAFVYWPDFVRGTPMVTSSGIGLGAPNSGVLRANTVYEFTYSIFNKRLNFETNVGVPVKIQTGTDEWLGLQLWTGGSTDTIYGDYVSGTANALFPIFTDIIDPTVGTGAQTTINHLEYRFYYRQEGTFEWLPALYIDAAKYWFYPFGGQLMACTGAIAALPGGQPGGFNDYSPLAKDNYTCVVQYKDRAFWFSEKQINFSLRNNIFAYPGRNSISAVAGEFKGGILHNYPGQAEQSSRLVIFGTRETYVARFTGQKQQANVQVSADTSAVFDIDGSDLVIDPWTSVTAFSYRSAAVAEGILYWWGPQGVFRDDGVQTPTRISGDLEPNLFSLYDPNKTDEITASYNNQTKEIEWFFTPKTTTVSGEVNSSLIFNTISQTWTRGSYKQQIDWMQGVTVDTNIGTAGFREVVGTRVTAAATTQRAYYFDQRNRAGDMCPTRDFIVKTVATPSSGVRRLTLAAGYDATNFATIAVGDLIGLQQVTSYSGLSADDMIAKVAAINTGAGTLDITLPEGAALATGSLTYDQFFPIWQRTPTGAGLNGIPYYMPTNYWLPKGPNGYYFWYYVYMLSKMRLWATEARNLGWTFGYRSPTAAGVIDDQITFEDNSDGNFQVYHPLRPGNDNMEGQGLKLILSGFHIGHEWVLQYLEAHGHPRKGDTLKRFEG